MARDGACACSPTASRSVVAEPTKKLKYLKNAKIPRFVHSESNSQFLLRTRSEDRLIATIASPPAAMPAATGAASHQSFEEAHRERRDRHENQESGAFPQIDCAHLFSRCTKRGEIVDRG